MRIISEIFHNNRKDSIHESVTIQRSTQNRNIAYLRLNTKPGVEPEVLSKQSPLTGIVQKHEFHPKKDNPFETHVPDKTSDRFPKMEKAQKQEIIP